MRSAVYVTVWGDKAREFHILWRPAAELSELSCGPNKEKRSFVGVSPFRPRCSARMPWGTRPCTARLRPGRLLRGVCAEAQRLSICFVTARLSPRLVECSADVNLVDAHGNTPLILAALSKTLRAPSPKTEAWQLEGRHPRQAPGGLNAALGRSRARSVRGLVRMRPPCGHRVLRMASHSASGRIIAATRRCTKRPSAAPKTSPGARQPRPTA